MRWRRQLPAYSPLPLSAVLSGAAGLLRGGDAARKRVAADLRARFGAADALLTDSGTGALTLAMRASVAGRPRAALALPAYGCYDLATAADGAGAPVVLYDIDPATLAPNLGSLRRALEEGVGALVLVYLYGVPVDPRPVRAAAEAAGAWLIEDAAQGAGASFGGRPLGCFGDVAVLSFGRGKGTTAGRGGALFAPSQRGSGLLAAAREHLLPPAAGYRDCAHLAAQWLFGRPRAYSIPASLPFLRLGETVYHAPSPVRAMSDVAARTLAVTLPLAGREAEVRRAHAERLARVAAGRLQPVRGADGAQPGYLRLPFLSPEAAGAALISAEARALGAMPGYPRALCDLDGFARRVLNGSDAFEGARRAARSLVTLPTHSLLSEGDLTRLATWLEQR